MIMVYTQESDEDLSQFNKILELTKLYFSILDEYNQISKLSENEVIINNIISKIKSNLFNQL